MRPKKTIFRFGIDLGGTKIESVILDNNGKEIFRKRISTDKSSYERILEDVKHLYQEQLDFVKGDAHTFGIGSPGSSIRKSTIIKNSNIICINDRPFVDDLEKAIGRKVYRENDSNCFAIAEANFGAGQGKKLVFGAILGTGIGGGLIMNGQLISGLQSIAGEWGHTIINSIGNTCPVCRKIGCIETYISGSGMEKQFFETYGEHLTMKEILIGYRQGDRNCQQLMSLFFVYFGKAISNVIGILDPDVIVLGGGLSNIEELYVLGINRVKDYVFNNELRTPIVRNKLGDSAGVLGAALIGK